MTPAMIEAVLDGGPNDGQTATVTADTRYINGLFMWPIPPPPAHPPRPSRRDWPWRYWRRLRAWKAWVPPLVIPREDHLIWERTGHVRDGRPVFRLTSPWSPYRIGVEPGADLVRALAMAASRCHPVIRADHRTRFVLSPGTFTEIRRIAAARERYEPPRYHPADEPPPPPEPPMLLGLRVEIGAAGDYLINPAWPDGWPDQGES